MTAMNITIPLPLKVPIGFYADIIYYEQPSGNTSSTSGSVTTYIYYPPNVQLTYSGGVYISLAKGVAEIYFPLFKSDDIDAYWKSNGYNNIFERASFLFNLNKLNPLKKVRNL